MTSEEPDDIVEIDELRNGRSSDQPECVEAIISSKKAGSRRYICVLFECCSVYIRIYRGRSGTAYEGRCPRCLRQVRVKIGKSGTDTRFFVAK